MRIYRLAEVIDLADRNEVVICTSSIVFTEALGDSGNPVVRDHLKALFRRPNFVTLDVNPALAEKAGEIRENARVDGRSIKTPDSVFLATALAFRVHAMHTFDDKVLALSGSPSVDGLTITKPRGTQTILPL